MRMADRTLSDQHGIPNIFQQKCPDALRACEPVGLDFASRKCDSRTQADGDLGRFLAPNAARVQAQLSHKSALGSKKFWLGGGNFFHPTQNPLPGGWGSDFFV